MLDLIDLVAICNEPKNENKCLIIKTNNGDVYCNSYKVNPSYKYFSKPADLLVKRSLLRHHYIKIFDNQFEIDFMMLDLDGVY